jgi:ribokinase
MSGAARRLMARGVKAVLITLGAKGVFVADAAGRTLLPAFKVKVVDTTAAGDVFNGALAVALAEGRSLLEAARFAIAAAALAVTKLGAQPSAPKRAVIERFLYSKRKISFA